MGNARLFLVGFGIAVGIALSAMPVVAAEVDTYQGQYVVAGEVLVEYEDGDGPELIERAMSVLSHRALVPVGTPEQQQQAQERLANQYIAQFSDGDLDKIIETLAQDPNVKAVQPNYIYRPLAVPNDALYPYQWAHKRTRTEQSWDFTTGNGVIVGVVDSGIDYNHPDLAGNMWRGRVDGQEVYGWNYYDNNADPIDPFGHGSNVAGIIGATGNNTLGVAGVNWNTKLMALRVLGAENLDIGQPGVYQGVFTTTEAIMRAIQFGADNGARVIVLSLGGVPSQQCNPAVGVPSKPIEEELFRDLTLNSRVLFVAAAGNDETNANCVLPARYEHVLAVTATDNADKAASYSNFTPDSWKNSKVIAAPGGDADPSFPDTCTEASCPVTTHLDSRYVAFSGTSAAAPYVAGVAALVLSIKDMDPLELRQLLIDSADDVVDSQSLGGRTGITYGKRINTYRALLSLSAQNTPTPPGTECTITGDLDCSGEVNLLDLSILLSGYGTSDPTGDIDGSGEVNLLDLQQVLSRYGNN